TASELDLEAGAGGLTIVGSYAERTTSQLERIIADGNARVFELVLARKAPDGLADLAAVVAGHLAAGEDVVLHTSRTHTPDVAPEIADALATFIRVLPARPRYLLVKGGTTAGH